MSQKCVFWLEWKRSFDIMVSLAGNFETSFWYFAKWNMSTFNIMMVVAKWGDFPFPHWMTELK